LHETVIAFKRKQSTPNFAIHYSTVKQRHFYRAACNADARYSDENSVRLSVCPSVRHTRAL